MTRFPPHSAAATSLCSAVVLVSLLTGCAGGTSSEETQRFCDDADHSDVVGMSPERFVEIAGVNAGTEAPEEIAEDWKTYTAGLTALADEIEESEDQSPEADAYFATMMNALSLEYADASERISKFVEENCGS